MRNLTRLSTYVAGASTLALLLTTSAFAESRHHDRTNHTDRSAVAPRGDSRGQGNSHVDRSQRAPVEERGQTRTYDRGFSGGTNQSSRSYNQGDRNYSQGDRNYRQGDRNYAQGAYRGYTQGNTGYSRDTSAYRNNNRYDNRSFDRGQWGRSSGGNWAGRGREEFRNGIPRSDGRVSTLGRVSRYEHERGGYRIWLGGSAYPYWVPESYFFGRHLGIGLDFRFGGIFRDGAIYVDALGWPGDAYYTDPYYYDSGATVGTYSVGTYDNGVRGVVDGIDFRAGLLYVRDDASRRVIAVDMRRVDRRYSNVDFGDLHPGDRVSIGGAWIGDGTFAAASINAAGY